MSVRTAPRQHGIYIFRMGQGKCIPRLQGESDIFYIGSTESKNGLRGRLRQYLRPGPTQWTNKRTHELAKKYEMEIAWCRSEEPSNLEHQLLRRYLNDHDELPPLNRAGKRLLKKLFTESVVVGTRLIVEHRNKEGKLLGRVET